MKTNRLPIVLFILALLILTVPVFAQTRSQIQSIVLDDFSNDGRIDALLVYLSNNIDEAATDFPALNAQIQAALLNPAEESLIDDFTFTEDVFIVGVGMGPSLNVLRLDIESIDATFFLPTIAGYMPDDDRRIVTPGSPEGYLLSFANQNILDGAKPVLKSLEVTEYTGDYVSQFKLEFTEPMRTSSNQTTNILVNGLNSLPATGTWNTAGDVFTIDITPATHGQIETLFYHDVSFVGNTAIRDIVGNRVNTEGEYYVEKAIREARQDMAVSLGWNEPGIGGTVEVTATVTYPTEFGEGLPLDDLYVDAFITSDPAIPQDAVVTIFYNNTQVGTYNVIDGDGANLWLSDMLGGPQGMLNDHLAANDEWKFVFDMSGVDAIPASDDYNITATSVFFLGDDLDPVDNYDRNKIYYNDSDEVDVVFTHKVYNVTREIYYSSIQLAIDDANENDTVIVYNGTFMENIIIGVAGLTLKNADPVDGIDQEPIIDGGGSGTVVTIVADNVIFDGFKIQNSGIGSPNPHAGISINGTTGVQILNNDIDQTQIGIALVLSDDNTVEGNDISLSTLYGIALAGSSENTIKGNVIDGITVKDGIAVDQYPSPLTYSTNNVITENTIKNIANDGIFVGHFNNPTTITDNNIGEFDNGIGGIGIHLWRGNSGVVTGNTVSDADVGIKLRGSVDLTVTGNTITENGIGIEAEPFYFDSVWHQLDDYTIRDNKIVGNTGFGFQATHVQQTAPIDARINWWGDLTGPLHDDTNLDGQGNAVTDNVLFYPWYLEDTFYPEPDHELVEATVTLNGFDSNVLTVEFSEVVKYTVAGDWSGFDPEAIVATLVNNTDKATFLDTFFEFDSTILYLIDLDKVTIAGTDKSFIVTIADDAVNMSYALDNGNTGASRVDFEWIGTDLFETVWAEAGYNQELNGPDETEFKIEFAVPYTHLDGPNYDEDATSTFIEKDELLTRPHAPGVKFGDLVLPPVQIDYATGSYATGLSATVSVDEAPATSYTSNDELITPGVYEVVITNDSNDKIVAEAHTTLRFTIGSYHTYEFQLEDVADSYIVGEALVNPEDNDFDGMDPVKLSVEILDTNQFPYNGMVRVAAPGADDIQLWAKDSNGNWHDINLVGWGPSTGFPIMPGHQTDVYVIATAPFVADSNPINLELIDITGDYYYPSSTDPIVDQTEFINVHSTYDFAYTVPSLILDGVDAVMDVYFATVDVGQLGFDNIRFRFTVTSAPDGGNVQFSAIDSENNLYNATNTGFWGPSTGFDLPAYYSETTEWTLNFSHPGTYEISFELIEAPDGAVIAGITKTQEIEVLGVPTVIYVDDDWSGTTYLAAVDVEETKFFGYNAFDTIQGAIDAANNDVGRVTIEVAAGTYTENVIVDKLVTMQGATTRSQSIIDGSGIGTVVTITNDEVVMTGFVVKNSGIGQHAGVAIVGASEVVLAENTIQDNSFGVVIASNVDTNSNDNIIIDNTIVNNVIIDEGQVLDSYGVMVTNQLFPGEGVVRHNVITGNSISGSKDGIYLDYAEFTYIGEYLPRNGLSSSGNEIFGNYYRGIHIYKGSENQVVKNIIRDNGVQGTVGEALNSAGIRIAGSIDNEILYNEIYNQTETDGVQNKGVRLFDSDGINPTGNVINYNKIYGHNEGSSNFNWAVDNRGYDTLEPIDVDASFNWWGFATGPFHATNPNGEGNAVTDNVLFDPWFFSEDMNTVNGLPDLTPSAIADISTIPGTPFVFSTTIDYTVEYTGYDFLNSFDETILTDALVYTTDEEDFPAGTKVIDILYNDVSVLQQEFELEGDNTYYLSEILGNTEGTELTGHDGLTVEWTIVVLAGHSEGTIPVGFQSLSYVDRNGWNNNLGDPSEFNITLADVTVDPIDDIIAGYPEDYEIDFAWDITYPLVENIGGDKVLNDSRFTFWTDDALTTPAYLPVDTEITVTTPIGNAFTSILGGDTHTVYGSAVVVHELDDPSTNEVGFLLPLTRNGGTDSWSVNIKNAPAGVIYVKWENLALLDFDEDGYPYDEFVYADQSFRVELLGSPTVLYVDENWSGSDNLQQVSPDKYYGHNAFSSFQDAYTVAEDGYTIKLESDVNADAAIIIEKDLTIDLANSRNRTNWSLEAHHILVKNADVVIKNGTLIPDLDIENWYNDGIATGNKYFVRTDRMGDGSTTKLELNNITIDGVIDQVTEDYTMILVGNAGRASLGGDAGIVATDELKIVDSSLEITKQTNMAAYAVYTFATNTIITGTNFNDSFRAIGIDGAFTPSMTLGDNDFSGVTAETITNVFIIPYASPSSGNGSVTVNTVNFAAGADAATVEGNLTNLTGTLIDDTGADNIFGVGSIILVSNNELFDDVVRARRYIGSWGIVYNPLTHKTVSTEGQFDYALANYTTDIIFDKNIEMAAVKDINRADLEIDLNSKEWTGYGLFVSENNVIVKNGKIAPEDGQGATDADLGASSGAAVGIAWGADNTILDNLVLDYNGGYVIHATNIGNNLVTIKNSTITQNTPETTGIFFSKGKANVIDNTFTGARAIVLGNFENVEIQDISDNTFNVTDRAISYAAQNFAPAGYTVPQYVEYLLTENTYGASLIAPEQRVKFTYLDFANTVSATTTPYVREDNTATVTINLDATAGAASFNGISEAMFEVYETAATPTTPEGTVTYWEETGVDGQYKFVWTKNVTGPHEIEIKVLDLVIATFEIDMLGLPKPTNLVADRGDNHVVLEWDAATFSGEVVSTGRNLTRSNVRNSNNSIASRSLTLLGYNIYRDGAILDYVGAPNTTYTDNIAEPNPNYTYYVTAVYDGIAEESDPSNEVLVVFQQFVPIWDGIAEDYHEFVILPNFVQGFVLQEKDEIGIFDGTVCVGAVKLEGPIGQYISIISAEYTAGSQVTVKVWIDETQTMYDQSLDELQVYYDQKESTNPATDHEIFVDRGYSVLGFTPLLPLERTIQLTEGWNIISFNVMPEGSSNLLNLLQPLIDAEIFITARDGQNSITKNPFTGAWQDNIGDIVLGSGYRVRVSADYTLEFSGTPAIIPLSYPLNNGEWFLIGHPYVSSAPATSVLEQLFESGIVRRVIDQFGNSISYIEFLDLWIDNIGDFEPGQGYHLRIDNNATEQQRQFVFDFIQSQHMPTLANMNEVTVKSKIEDVRENAYFQKIWDGNGLQHFNVFLLNNDDLSGVLTEGDEIAIFDGDYCVATAVYNEGEQFITLTASMNDEFVDWTNGFTPGNEFSMHIWLADQQVEIQNVEFEVLEGYSTFEILEQSIISVHDFYVSSDDVTENLVPVVTEISSIFPNPFNPDTTIKFSLHQAGSVNLEVYNIRGQRVKTLVSDDLEAGNHQITWNGTDDNGRNVSSGIYFTRLVTEDRQVIRKMTLMK